VSEAYGSNKTRLEHIDEFNVGRAHCQAARDHGVNHIPAGWGFGEGVERSRNEPQFDPPDGGIDLRRPEPPDGCKRHAAHRQISDLTSGMHNFLLL
jgi:hypothetical protein